MNVKTIAMGGLKGLQSASAAMFPITYFENLLMQKAYKMYVTKKMEKACAEFDDVEIIQEAEVDDGFEERYREHLRKVHGFGES